MSVRPFSRQMLVDDHFFPEVVGARRYPVQSTEENLNLICGIHNARLNPYLIDFDTLKILDVKPLGMRGTIQKIAVKIKYLDPNGVEHVNDFPHQRYNLQVAFASRLTLQHWWYVLPCEEYQPFGVILALEEIGINLTLEDVDITFVENNLVQIEAKRLSLGWFGEVHVRLI